MKIILIGKAGSGKDTVAEYLSGAYGFVQYAFADHLKEWAQDINPEKYRDDRRRFLQELGAAIREFNRDYWAMYVYLRAGDDRVVISDCRYQNEYDIGLDYGFIPVMVDCDTLTRADRLYKRDGRHMTTDEMMHASEQLNVKCDYRLDNNGSFDELYTQIDAMVIKISEEVGE